MPVMPNIILTTPICSVFTETLPDGSCPNGGRLTPDGLTCGFYTPCEPAKMPWWLSSLLGAAVGAVGATLAFTAISAVKNRLR